VPLLGRAALGRFKSRGLAGDAGSALPYRAPRTSARHTRDAGWRAAVQRCSAPSTVKKASLLARFKPCEGVLFFAEVKVPDARLNKMTGDARHDLQEPVLVTAAMRSICR